VLYLSSRQGKPCFDLVQFLVIFVVEILDPWIIGHSTCFQNQNESVCMYLDNGTSWRIKLLHEVHILGVNLTILWIYLIHFVS
jgi:hypothetical protein